MNNSIQKSLESISDSDRDIMKKLSVETKYGVCGKCIKDSVMISTDYNLEMERIKHDEYN